jgi:glycosyltransferase involved in cell wall biosynthesis
MARGEFVAFLDSDDVWDARFMEKMLAALRQASWAGLAYCDYATFDDRGVIQAACLAPNEKIRGNLFPKLIEGDFLCTGSLLIRRTCLEQAGRFDPGLAVAHDWDMWLRLAWRNDAEYLDEPLLKIRFHPGNLSRNAQQVHTDNLRILAKLRRDFQAKRFHPAIRTTALRSHRALFSHYRRTRRPLSALKQLGLMAVVRFL